MSEFHERLIAAAAKLGARHVRLQHGGSRGASGRFRRHPHLLGEIAGKAFRFPVKLRPKDTPRRWHNYVGKLRHLLRTLADEPAPAAAVTVSVRKRKHLKTYTRFLSWVPTEPIARQPTRLDQDPFAVLAKLLVQKIGT